MNSVKSLISFFCLLSFSVFAQADKDSLKVCREFESSKLVFTVQTKEKTLEMKAFVNSESRESYSFDIVSDRTFASDKLTAESLEQLKQMGINNPTQFREVALYQSQRQLAYILIIVYEKESYHFLLTDFINPTGYFGSSASCPQL